MNNEQKKLKSENFIYEITTQVSHRNWTLDIENLAK